MRPDDFEDERVWGLEVQCPVVVISFQRFVYCDEQGRHGVEDRDVILRYRIGMSWNCGEVER